MGIIQETTQFSFVRTCAPSECKKLINNCAVIEAIVNMSTKGLVIGKLKPGYLRYQFQSRDVSKKLLLEQIDLQNAFDDL